MQTKRIQIASAAVQTTAAKASLLHAAQILRAGGTVAFPTETVYGLGANALDASAVAKIFAAKLRPVWDPLIVHVANRDMLNTVIITLPQNVEVLIQKFWPGPLTLLLPRNPNLPLSVTAGRDLVGVRMPNHPVALALIGVAGVPIAAPSANLFGHTSPTTAQHVLADLDERIDAVIDSGVCAVGLESTVLDPVSTPPIVYRPGAITLEMLRNVIGEVELYTPSINPQHEEQAVLPSSLPSPGVGIRHYAPRARLLLANDRDHLAALHTQFLQEGKRVGVLLPHGWDITSNGIIIYPWAAMSDPETQAQTLFAALHTLDDLGVDIVLVPIPEAQGIGVAMLDRLCKAAMEK